ncbi:MAG: toll/interleukin-1 receptor domain-containing protein, partial [Acidimicrobiia bacterium]
MEIATALHTGKPVIPVLVGEASMPDGGVLPSDIAPLARRPAYGCSATTSALGGWRRHRSSGGRGGVPSRRP